MAATPPSRAAADPASFRTIWIDPDDTQVVRVIDQRRLPLRLAAVVAERTLRRTGSTGAGPAPAAGGKGGGDA